MVGAKLRSIVAIRHLLLEIDHRLAYKTLEDLNFVVQGGSYTVETISTND